MKHRSRPSGGTTLLNFTISGTGLPTLLWLLPVMLTMNASSARSTKRLQAARFRAGSCSGVRSRSNIWNFQKPLDTVRLGSESSTAWANEKLYQIIVHRHNAQLPTVITTRAIPSAAKDPVASRLNDARLVQIMPITAPDYRDVGR